MTLKPVNTGQMRHVMRGNAGCTRNFFGARCRGVALCCHSGLLGSTLGLLACLVHLCGPKAHCFPLSPFLAARECSLFSGDSELE